MADEGAKVGGTWRTGFAEEYAREDVKLIRHEGHRFGEVRAAVGVLRWLRRQERHRLFFGLPSPDLQDIAEPEEGSYEAEDNNDGPVFVVEACS